ncbi:MAG: CDP-alcohol phosphatidyltransferase family protein [Deltaproteobacteria bacterium]|nr:CDP-alcohol phosphatidyltransferase family protein [Deltaproteobacteria bacterium]
MHHSELITLWWHIAPLIILNSVFFISMLFFWLIFWDGKDHPELVGRTNTKLLTVHLKNWWYWVTTPLLDILLALRATPNAVTTLGLLLSIAAGFAFSQGYLGTAGWLMIFGGYCDSLDGRVARARRMESRAGSYYDAMLDRLGEA